MTEVPQTSSSPAAARPFHRRWWFWWLAVLVVLTVFGSISLRRGSTGETGTKAEASALVIEAPTSAPVEVAGTVVRPVCVLASATALEAVIKARVGADVTIRNGFVVEIGGAHVTGAPAFVLAAKLVSPGAPDQLGTWGMGTADGGTPLWALNKAAQTLTSWLASAEKGSAEDQLRTALAGSPEATVAIGCASL
jgi:hypothetical protein